MRLVNIENIEYDTYSLESDSSESFEIIGRKDLEKMAICEIDENKIIIHAKWIDCSSGWMCNNCNHDNKADTKFCPNCGAIMDLK